MPRRARLDAELVRRGLARSRDQAVELVHDGRVQVRGRPATKPATAVLPDDPLRVVDLDVGEQYVSRGAHKLIGALDALADRGLSVSGRRCLDAGASTGGFTDVLLRRGAESVHCVDVGYGQLAWPLRTDQRVTTVDRTNVRELTAEQIDGPASLTVADLSFISLRLVLPALAECTRPEGDLLPMVKPQFEVGRGQLGSGGVVREPELRADAVCTVAAAAAAVQLGVQAVIPSPLPGPSGNREFFLWLRRGEATLDAQGIRAAVLAVGA